MCLVSVMKPSLVSVVFADVVLMVRQVLSRRSSMCLVSVMKPSLVSVVFADVVLMVLQVLSRRSSTAQGLCLVSVMRSTTRAGVRR